MVAKTRGARLRSKSPAPEQAASRVSARQALRKEAAEARESSVSVEKTVTMTSRKVSTPDFLKIAEVRFALYLIGLYTLFLKWGLVQEKLTSSETVYLSDSDGSVVKWEHPLALNAGMAAFAWLTTVLFERLLWRSPKKVHWKHFWKAAATSALASPFGYASLSYISFPLMILTKSCKPIPVMVIGFFRYAVRYPWYKYVSVGLLSGGIAMFCAYQPPKAGAGGGAGSSPADFTDVSLPFTDISFALPTLFIGISMVLMNLTLDGFTNNEQDFLFSKYKASSIQMMGNVNLWQTIYLTGYLLAVFPLQGADSELHKAVTAVVSSSAVRFDLAMFFLCASLGQLLIFSVMEEFGSLTWVTIGITRKMFTIVLSVIIFNHKFNIQMWVGVGLVFAGMFLEVFMKYSESGKKAALKVSKAKKRK